MAVRIFAIPAGLVVLLLVGAAMFQAESSATSKPISVSPGQKSPHEDRGICAACHLLGGPGAQQMPDTGNATRRVQNAPAIRIDQIRPHGERGSCVNCHQIMPTAQITAAADQWAQMAPAVNPLLAQQMMATPNLGWGGQPQRLDNGGPAWNNNAQMGGGPSGPAWGNNAQMGGGPVGPAWDNAQMGRGNGVPPPIAQGTPAPHGWRGDCVSCHNVLSINTWTPTPPLTPNTNNGRRPPETEALGMAVRATNEDVVGMMVMEVEGIARKGGLKLGDVVRAVDGQVTTDIPSFKSATRNADPRNGVVVDVVRDGKAQALILK